MGSMRFIIGAAAISSALLAVSPALATFPTALPRQPQLYRIRGYMDSAPVGVTIRDRLQISSRHGQPRELLVTEYGDPGEIPLTRELSSVIGPPRFTVSGKQESVERLFETADGVEIEAVFVAYTSSARMLVLGNLESSADGDVKPNL